MKRLEAICLLIYFYSLYAGAGRTRAEDCNGNLIDDAQEIDVGASPDCNRNGIPDGCDLLPVNLGFGEPREFEASQQHASPNKAVFGDFDGDQDVDAVIINDPSITASASLAILINADGGNFNPPQFLFSARNPNLAAADVDGDGDLDLAASGAVLQESLTIHLNRGDGAFERARVIPGAPTSPSDLLAADLDSDGWADLASVSQFNNKLKIYRNQGVLLFRELEIEAHREFYHLHALDLTGDLWLDLLAVPSAPEGIGAAILINNPGDASFIVEKRFEDFSLLGASLVADFDGDGDADFFSINRLSLNDGSGRFSPGKPPDLLLPKYNLSAADLNGDGAAEVFVIDNLQLAVYTNTGSGDFRPPLIFPLPQASFRIQAADLNRDGIQDLLAGESGCGNVVVLLGEGASSPRSRDLDDNGIPDECQADCNQNGLPDSLEIQTSRVPDCNRNSIPDGCDATPIIQFASPRRILSKQAESEDLDSHITADLDADGDADLAAIISDYKIDIDPRENIFIRYTKWSLIMNDGSGAFGPPAELVLPSVYSLAAADFDGDGDVDLLSAHNHQIDGFRTRGELIVHKNDGNGAFQPLDGLPIIANIGKLFPVELNRDGKPDLLINTSGNKNLKTSILLGRGDGMFDKGEEFVTDEIAAAADLDGDGAADLVINSPPPDQEINMQLNTGAGAFAPRRNLMEGTARAVADFNGDRYPDLVIHGDRCFERFLLLNKGDAAFETITGFVNGAIPIDGDGDGDLDLIDASLWLRYVIFLNDGGGHFGIPLRLDIPQPATRGLFADFNGDGLVDIASSSYEPEILLNLLANLTSPAPGADRNRDGVLDECQAAVSRQIPGDANQDGKLGISDAAWLLRHLFAGAGTRLPCEGGAAGDPGPGERALLDSTGDGALDLSDAIHVIRFLFAGGPSPASGSGCVAIAGCPARCAP